MKNLRPQALPILIAFVAICILALPVHVLALPIPIAHYTFDNLGNLGEDSQGSHDLTNSGAVTSATSVGAGFGPSIDTSGGFLYRTLGATNDPAFAPGTGEFAVSFWYQRNSNGSGVPVGRGDLANIGVDSTSGYAALVVDSSAAVNAVNGNILVQTAEEYAPPPSGASPGANTVTLPGSDTSSFQHVVIQRRAGNLELYLNGNPSGSSAFGTTLDTLNSFAVGAGSVAPDGTNFGQSNGPTTDVPTNLNFDGLVDDVQIFDFGLTPAEVIEIFGSEPIAPGSGPIPEPSSLVLLVLGMIGLSRVRRRR